MQLTKFIKLASFLFALLWCGANSLKAQSITNADVTTNLYLGPSWVGGVPAGSNNIAVWDSTVQINGTKALGSNVAWAGIQILNPGVGIAISAGNTLTNGASGIDMTLATTNLTLNNPVVLGTNQSWLVTNNATLNVNGVVSGSGILTLNNSNNAGGLVNFGAQANTYTNATVINGGVVFVNAGASFGTGNVTNNGGITRWPAGTTLTLANAFFYNNTSLIDINGQVGNDTYSGAWSGNGTVIITNMTNPNSTLTLGGANAAGNMNAFNGKIVFAPLNTGGLVSQGTLRFNSGTTSFNFGSAGASFNLGTNGSGIILTSRDNGTINIGELIGGPNSALLGSRSTTGTTIWSVGGLNTSTTFAGVISNFATTEIAALTKVGTGTLTLTSVNNSGANGTNGPTGPTVVSAGVLQIGDGTADGSLTGGNVTVANGATLSFNRPDSFIITNNLANSGTVSLFGGGTLTYNTGAYTGNGSINVTNGSFFLSGAVTNFGSVYVGSTGTFDMTGVTGFQSGQSLGGSGIINNGSSPITVTSSVIPGGPGTAGTLTINGGLTESGNVNNQFVLSSAGSTNDLVVVNGNLNVGTGTQYLTLSGFGGSAVPPGVYPLFSYTGSLTGGTNSFTVIAIGFGAIVTNITSVTPNQIAVIVVPAPRQILNLTWVGDGVSNNWDLITPNVWVNQSTNYAFISGDKVVFDDSGSATPAINLAAFLVPTSLTVSNTAKNYTFSGPGIIGGSTGLTKTNGGTLTILNTNAYTGPTVIGGGVLEIASGPVSGSPSPLGATSSDPSNLVFYGGSTLRYTGSDAAPATDRGLTSTSGATLDVSNSATTLTLNGLITGAGSLAKIGPGTLALPNVNTYTGGTVVSNGLLALTSNNANYNGSTGSAVGPTNAAVTFGNNAILQLFGWVYASTNANPVNAFNNFFNPLVVPSGQTGTLELPPRGNPATGAGAGLNSKLTGSGTLNLIADYVRYPLSGDWSAFTGLINVTGAGFTNINANTVNAVTANIDELRINNTFGYTNAAIYLAGSPHGAANSPPSVLVMCGTVAANTTYNIGELGGVTGTIIGNGTGSEGNTTWSVGWKNTTNTFEGLIQNDTQAATGVTAITKVGTGKWILTGQNTYTGATIVSNGVLALGTNSVSHQDGSISASTNIFINAGATLDVSALGNPVLSLGNAQNLGGGGTLKGGITATGGSSFSPGGSNAVGALTIQGKLTESGSVNHVFFLSSPAGTNDVMNVQGDLDVSGGAPNLAFFEFGGGTVTPGVYPLITYTGNLIGGAGSFAVPPGPFSYTAIVTNITTTTPKSIGVIIVPPVRGSTNLTWKGDGANNYVDLTESNWVNGATSYLFLPLDSVLFSDSGAPNTNVYMVDQLFASSVTLSNSILQTYTFNDFGGSFAGPFNLTKTNTGTVNINNNNTYTGVTTLGAGTISIANLPNGGQPGPLGAATSVSSNIVFAGGTLAITGSPTSDRGMTVNAGGGTIDVATNQVATLNGIIAGAGALSVVDGGTLALGATSTYTGGTKVNTNATLVLNVVAGAGTGAIAMNGGTLDLAVTGSPTYAMGINVVSNSTLTVATGSQINPQVNGAFTGSNTLLIAMPSGVNNTLGIGTGGMYNFTGTLKFPDATTLTFLRFFPSTGTGSGTNGSSNATFDLGDNGSGVNLFDRVGNATDLIGALIGGPLTVLSGAASATAIPTRFAIGGKNLSTTFNGSIRDGTQPLPLSQVSVTKVGTGTLTLGGSNTYSGPTLVSNGVLQVTGSLGVTTNGSNAITINGGQLAGFGLIYGAVTNAAGGTLAPGAGTNVAGTTLTISSNLTMLAGSTNTFQVSHVGGGKSDKVLVGGTITYGGVLNIVTNSGDPTPYALGNKFTLFTLNGGNYNVATTFSSIQPAPGPGLGWSANPADGSITVIVAPAPVANFTGAPTNIFASQFVVFTNTSTGSYTNSVWNFGNGTSVTNSGATAAANVTNIYNTVGTNTVSLVVTGNGSSTNTITNYIVVYPRPSVATAALSGTNFVLKGSTGVPFASYRILSSTNLTTTNWVPVFTNTFAADGSYSYTNFPVTNQAKFFQLVSP